MVSVIAVGLEKNMFSLTPDGETPVYAIPSSSSKRIGLIRSETSYPIIEEFNDFFAISLRGASGFVVKP